MSYEARSIAFLSEILYQPIQLRVDAVQSIHNALYKRPEIRYVNFQIAQDGIHLANPPETPGAVSVVSFLPDRIVVREELRNLTAEDYATRLVEVASVALPALGVTSSPAQQFVVRTLITPRHTADSRDFFARKIVSGPTENWTAFGRPLASLGMRLAFPQTDQHREVYNVRVETWNQDPRSLWLENLGSFPGPMEVENLPQLGVHLHATYAFLTGPVFQFVGSFDRP
ncbi:MAG: hypothetical protein IT458_15545 [Planctomycetes bacterium]|nr:hypothetical protein [Planctomycetota bacterium]